jgi:hypothetical protein
MHPYVGLNQARTELAARRGRGGARKNAYLRHPIEGAGDLPAQPLGIAYRAPVGGAAHYRPDPRETAALGYLRNRAVSKKININGNAYIEPVRVGAPIRGIADIQNEGLADAPLSTFYEPLVNFAAAGGSARGKRGHARARHTYM